VNTVLIYSPVTDQWGASGLDWAIDADVFNEHFLEMYEDEIEHGSSESLASFNALSSIQDPDYWEDSEEETNA